MRRLFVFWLGAAAMLAPMAGCTGTELPAVRTVAAAAETAPAIEPGLPVWVNGKEAEFAPAAAMVNGALFVPVVPLAEKLGVKVEKLEGEQPAAAIAASAGDTRLVMRLGESAMEVNGRKVPLPYSPYIYEASMYVPLRPFAEALGHIVRWDAVKGAVVVEQEWTGLPAVGTEAKLKELLDNAAVNGSSAVGIMKSAVTESAPAPVPAAGAAAPQAAADTAAGGSAGAAAGSANYSRTNVQVEGVDEGDIVKTDGSYLYQLSRQQLKILRAAPAEQLAAVGTMNFSDEQFTPSELYVDGDRLVVVGRSYRSLPSDQLPQDTPSPQTDTAAPAVRAESSPGIIFEGKKIMPLRAARSTTKAIVVNIENRAKPTIVRSVELEGDAVATRKIGNFIYMAANKYVYNAKELLGPAYKDSAVSGSEWRQVELPKLRYFPGQVEPNVLLIGGFDMTAPDAPMTLSSYLGSGQNVYMSSQSLYVTQTRQRWLQPEAAVDQPSIAVVRAEQTTTVYRFKLDNGRVSFVAKGDVPGSPLNQFSMDEYDDVFRIATTQSEGNALYTLDQSMQTIGRLERLAPGERIYSARFMGGRAYLVTFKQVDPLFVIDVSNPRSPAVLGALKIPGYSDYLHPYDETHLIGFGKDTVLDSYGNALYQGMKLSLFDVSDVGNPIELFKTGIGDRGTESDLLRDHKALLFDKERGLLAFPVAVREVKADGGGAKDPHAYGNLTFQGAYVYSLDLNRGFQWKGGITHMTEQDQLKAGYDGYDPLHAVRRALYIGDTLYTVSDGSVKANRLDTLTELGYVRH
ncbi:beta-propeller domain-containing protein [Paenibacillus chartarius]|uniref:Beta-propeller domain-containing protein n=1 Tax=Paenibacillus chartarius TaxID=747481 RepID=A0ABV6DUL3_9BACL